MENFKKGYSELINRYNIIDNDTCVFLIEKSTELIQYIETLNHAEINRNKIEIKNIYYINANMLQYLIIDKKNNDIIFTCLERLKKFLNLEPFNIGAKNLFKNISLKFIKFDNNLEDKLQVMKSVLYIIPCDIIIQYELGNIYKDMKEYDKAISCYKLSIGIMEITVEDVKIKCEILKNLGNIYYSRKEDNLGKYYFDLEKKVRKISR